MTDLREVYLGYLECLNSRDWGRLPDFVADDVHYNGRRIGVEEYVRQRRAEARGIPDLRFVVELLVCEPPRVAARLAFDCAPTGEFLGLPVHGRRIVFTENVFYEFVGGRIVDVRSIVDRAAVEEQLR
jgi:predicted ester cyclase